MPRYNVQQPQVLSSKLRNMSCIMSLSKVFVNTYTFRLAYAEMYLTVARVACEFNMELHDTTPEDLEVHHARLTGCPKKGTGEVKVMITGRLDLDIAHKAE